MRAHLSYARGSLAIFHDFSGAKLGEPFIFVRQYKTLNDQPGAVKEKTKLDVGKWVVLDGGNLVINKIDRNDSGRYTCYGRDDNNNIYETAEVLVNCKSLNLLFLRLLV